MEHFFFKHRLIFAHAESLKKEHLIALQSEHETPFLMDIRGELVELNSFAIGCWCWWLNYYAEISECSVIDERLLCLLAELPRLILLEIFLIPAQTCRKCATHASLRFTYCISYILWQVFCEKIYSVFPSCVRIVRTKATIKSIVFFHKARQLPLPPVNRLHVFSHRHVFWVLFMIEAEHTIRPMFSPSFQFI